MVPDMRFRYGRPRSTNASRNVPTAVDEISHHIAEPVNTPVISSAAVPGVAHISTGTNAEHRPAAAIIIAGFVIAMLNVAVTSRLTALTAAVPSARSTGDRCAKPGNKSPSPPHGKGAAHAQPATGPASYTVMAGAASVCSPLWTRRFALAITAQVSPENLL
jgi:hypothetical protein